MPHYVPWYGLNGRPITDLEAEVLLTDLDSRRVATTAIPAHDGNVIVVSTMFSVTPAEPRQGGQVALWETIVVGDGAGGRIDHHTSRKEAERHHEALVADLRSRHEAGGKAGSPHPRQSDNARGEKPAYAAQR